jgi:hypothetical protein
MYPRFVILGIAIAGFSRSAQGDQAFPYKAYIVADDTYVRSGPGENYYPTNKLNAGTQIEVYRHDPGGWYAIRPPEGSFSWIGKRHLRPTRDGLAEVVGEQVAVRVGTQLTDRRDAVQIRVQRGEIVELLDRPKSGGSDRSGDVWCKVSPPAGEFRWVYGGDVDDRRPRKDKDSGQSPKDAAASATAAAKPTEWAAAKPPEAPPSSTRPRPSDDFQKQFDDINTEFSIMLAEEPRTWNCRDLGRRAQTLLDQAQTAVERGQARMLVNRIAQSEDVQRRSQTLNTAPAALDRHVQMASTAGSVRGARARGDSGDGRFDGVGRLARVQQSKVGAPRYALVDDQGNVMIYVSPAPGVAMQPYVGHEVGINGVRGFIAEQNADHLTAKHVTALDTRLR